MMKGAQTWQKFFFEDGQRTNIVKNINKQGYFNNKVNLDIMLFYLSDKDLVITESFGKFENVYGAIMSKSKISKSDCKSPLCTQGFKPLSYVQKER